MSQYILKRILYAAGVLLAGIFWLNVKAQTGLKTGKIPLDAKRWYQLNNTTGNLEALFDGATNKVPVPGWALMFDNWDAVYAVLPGETINLSSLKMYDWEGSSINKPTTIWVADKYFNKTKIATFDGKWYNKWVGPDSNLPDNYQLNPPINNVQYIIINTYGLLPSEIEFYGTYLLPNATTSAPTKKYPIANFLGVNGFEWNLLNEANPLFLDTAEAEAAKIFTGFRHYIDWERLELTQGKYTYNPAYKGGWNIDTLYQFLHQNGIEVLACINTVPQWLLNTYPLDSQQRDNSPIPFGFNKLVPESYVLQAKLGFQFAARYGSNTQVNPAQLSVNTTPRWINDPPNAVKIGLGTVHYIECTNEPDKWWKGRNAYQTAYEYAANLSAFYDGHMQTLGANVGVKNADPHMQVVMGGTAGVTTDYLKGMIDWCRRNRGYRPDGSVNICWDVVNYHYYANNGGSSQNGQPTNGAAPEQTDAALVAQDFINTCQQWGIKTPVWISETGYDVVSTNSTQFAPAIGTKLPIITQADWLLRTVFMYAKLGIERMFIYEMYNLSTSGQFGTCGLLNSITKKPQPAAEYLYQVRQKFGNYQFKIAISGNPNIDQYTYNNNTMYAVWMPTQSGMTTTARWNIGNVDSVLVYTPTANTLTMPVKAYYTSNELFSLTATETPQLVVPILSPTQIVAFNAQLAAWNIAALQWQVTADTLVEKFIVEKLLNNEFKSIAQIQPAATGNYTYYDTLISLTQYQYRIKVLLKNGKTFYSTLVTISAGNVMVGPNPFNNNLLITNLVANANTRLMLFHTSGKLVAATNTQSAAFEWNLPSLQKGTYFLITNSGQHSTVKQLLKL